MQSRVTDHRVNVTEHGVDQVMAGRLDGFIAALQLQSRAQSLEQLAMS